MLFKPTLNINLKKYLIWHDVLMSLSKDLKSNVKIQNIKKNKNKDEQLKHSVSRYAMF